MSIKKLLPVVQKNVSLKNYTTFKIGGKARYFFVAKSKNDLIKTVSTAKKLNLPFFILGGGSNLLVSDKGFNGLVIKIQNQSTQIYLSARPSPKLFGSGSKYKIPRTTKHIKRYVLGVRGKQNTKIITEAGTSLASLVSGAEEAGLTGLEWAAGIPGTVGGAVYGNATAFGISMSQLVESVETFDLESLKVKNFSKRQCKFFTKDSIFKRNKNLIILSVILKLKKGTPKNIKNKTIEYLKYRKERHPNLPSAGSVFVNPEVKIKDRKLLKQFLQLEQFNKRGFIPAGFLIEKCGLKGKKLGDVKISEKHANFIVNLGKGKAKDVIKLIKLVKKEVKKKFGIELKKEIELL